MSDTTNPTPSFPSDEYRQLIANLRRLSEAINVTLELLAGENKPNVKLITRSGDGVADRKLIHIKTNEHDAAAGNYTNDQRA